MQGEADACCARYQLPDRLCSYLTKKAYIMLASLLYGPGADQDFSFFLSPLDKSVASAS